jgi:phosphoribosyl-dephospho-CoA transferase
MNITFKQHILLLAGLTLLCDESAKVNNTEMQHEILELADIIQEYAERKQRADERRNQKS